jgi:uncharacterized protein (TIGR03663 family)
MVADSLDRRLAVAVGAVVLLGTTARMLFLGDRVAHWDEARVGYWILDFAHTGDYEYRPIIHGPFLQHANRLVFGLFGATDATMRYVPALVGGLLPLSALLFRERLRAAETLALAFFLAANPVLLYYSRFMRGDPLVGAFMFVAFALFVRAVDTRRSRYVFGAVGFVALGFTVKENAPVYVLCWLGAAAVVGWLRVVAARTAGERPLDGLLARYGRRARAAAAGRAPDGGRPREDLLDAGTRLLGIGLLAAAEFFAIIVYFYAPRSGDPGAGFGAALRDPSLLPSVVGEATVGSYRSFYDLWIAGGTSDHAYLPYLGDLAGTVAYGAGALCLFALIGFFVESYREGGPRGLVIGCFAWGVASLLGYPIITDIKAPWAAIHVVLPLAVPAAAGLVALVRGGQRAYAAEEQSLAVAGAFVLAFSAVSVGFVGYWGYHTTYEIPQSPDNELVQYAQPADDIHPEMAAVDRASRTGGDGPDVLLYGPFFVEESPPSDRGYRPACAEWFDALPLPWYFERSETSVQCARNATQLDAVETAPPVIVVKVEHRQALERRFPDYDVTPKMLRATDTKTVFLIDRSRLDAPANATAVRGAAAGGGSGGDSESAPAAPPRAPDDRETFGSAGASVGSERVVAGSRSTAPVGTPERLTARRRIARV